MHQNWVRSGKKDIFSDLPLPAPTRQKITFGEMRAGGVRGLLIYCSKSG
jgi:hypothetical protein